MAVIQTDIKMKRPSDKVNGCGPGPRGGIREGCHAAYWALVLLPDVLTSTAG